MELHQAYDLEKPSGTVIFLSLVGWRKQTERLSSLYSKLMDVQQAGVNDF
jgi:hypothetical protein